MSSYIEVAREDLSLFMGESGKTQNQVAKEMGISSSVISQFLKGAYTGDNENTAKSISQYLEIARERLSDAKETTFYEGLQNTKEVLLACKYAHRKNEIVLVRGDAGAGKTTALEHYMAHNTGVIFVTADSCTVSPTAILNLIAEEMGLKPINSKARIMKTLITNLAETSRLVIIDEADHLSFDALQAIRNLNDKCKIGIVLAGNNKLYNQMVTGPRGGEYDQIRTRIIKRAKVSNNYSPDEISAIFPNLDNKSLNYIVRLARKESLRAASKIYSLALDYTNAQKQSLSLKALEEIVKSQLGEAV